MICDEIIDTFPAASKKVVWHPRLVLGESIRDKVRLTVNYLLGVMLDMAPLTQG